MLDQNEMNRERERDRETQRQEAIGSFSKVDAIELLIRVIWVWTDLL